MTWLSYSGILNLFCLVFFAHSLVFVHVVTENNSILCWRKFNLIFLTLKREAMDKVCCTLLPTLLRTLGLLCSKFTILLLDTAVNYTLQFLKA